MTTFYGTHFTETPPALLVSALDDPAIKVAPGFRHAKVMHTHELIDLSGATLAAGDDIVMFTMRSGDRLGELFFSAPAAWAATTLTLHLGLYEFNDFGLGPVIDEDLFNSALDGIATTARVDQFDAAVLEDEDRWKPLWQLANEGDGTYTADPNELWALALHIDVLTAVTVQDEYLLEAYYKVGTN